MFPHPRKKFHKIILCAKHDSIVFCSWWNLQKCYWIAATWCYRWIIFVWWPSGCCFLWRLHITQPLGSYCSSTFSFSVFLSCYISFSLSYHARIVNNFSSSVEQSVCASIYKDPSGGEPLQTVQLTESNGIWSAVGPKTWDGCYYVYEVNVYHHTTSKIEKCFANDPYARGYTHSPHKTVFLLIQQSY